MNSSSPTQCHLVIRPLDDSDPPEGELIVFGNARLRVPLYDEDTGETRSERIIDGLAFEFTEFLPAPDDSGPYDEVVRLGAWGNSEGRPDRVVAYAESMAEHTQSCENCSEWLTAEWLYHPEFAPHS